MNSKQKFQSLKTRVEKKLKKIPRATTGGNFGGIEGPDDSGRKEFVLWCVGLVIEEKLKTKMPQKSRKFWLGAKKLCVAEQKWRFENN